MNWKPIAEAPEDEVVCTDEGFAILRCADGFNLPRWYLCDRYENIPSCAEEGHFISEISPTKWITLEELFS